MTDDNDKSGNDMTDAEAKSAQQQHHDTREVDFPPGADEADHDGTDLDLAPAVRNFLPVS